jgi:glyoxylase-like metal-dependent hydrolase (beta-lactamase superfamily II)
MWLDVFDRNPYGTNCWLLAGESSDGAVVVDPGFEPAAVHRLLDAAGKQPVAILLTHAHVDHAGAAGSFAGDLPVFVHEADAVAFSDEAAWNAGFENPLDPVQELRQITGGESLHLAGVSITALHTPGHTPGHCCFRTDGLVFSGDLVFAGSIGRSDFPNGDPVAMQRSLAGFLTLPDDLDVLPGHGTRTSVGQERAANPFLQGEVASWN